MTPELKEACEVIASYMGYYLNDSGDIWLHDNKANILIDHDASWDSSLDSLVPVWEKQNLFPVFDKMGKLYSCELWQHSSCHHHFRNALSENMIEAACLATASAIKALTKDKGDRG